MIAKLQNIEIIAYLIKTTVFLARLYEPDFWVKKS